jgi:hypothetical protein
MADAKYQYKLLGLKILKISLDWQFLHLLVYKYFSKQLL